MKGFLIDINVISELSRPQPEPAVVAWVAGQDAAPIYVSVLTFGELRKGIAAHPDPVRRLRLEAWVEATLRPWFEGRVLPVDEAVAARWGHLAGQAHVAGRCRCWTVCSPPRRHTMTLRW